MVYFRFILLIVLSFFALKFLISYIEKATINLNNKAIKRQIELGLLSIKDIQRNNYSTFLKIINIYLDILGFKENTLIPNGNSNLTNFKSLLNNEDIFISCIQNNLLGETPADEDNWELTDRSDVQSFLGRIFINNCKKGILITNSRFSDKAIEFVKDFNNQNNGKEIKSRYHRGYWNGWTKICMSFRKSSMV